MGERDKNKSDLSLYLPVEGRATVFCCGSEAYRWRGRLEVAPIVGCIVASVMGLEVGRVEASVGDAVEFRFFGEKAKSGEKEERKSVQSLMIDCFSRLFPPIYSAVEGILKNLERELKEKVEEDPRDKEALALYNAVISTYREKGVIAGVWFSSLGNPLRKMLDVFREDLWTKAPVEVLLKRAEEELIVSPSSLILSEVGRKAEELKKQIIVVGGEKK